jgi:O-antigen ligase
MSASILAARPLRDSRSAATTRDGGPRGDDWPHTTRVLPWLLAGFLVMLWLVPFDAVDLPFELPVDTKLDRILLIGIAGLWLATMLTRGPAGTQARGSVLYVAVGAFVAVAGASVLVNLETLSVLEETQVAVKKLALLGSYVLFFLIVSTALRPSELHAFTTLLLALACIAAVGTVWEYRTGFNAFYEWFDQLMPSAVQVGSPPPDPMWGRPNNTGPTGHALAIATMLAIALPFAVVRLTRSFSAWDKVVYGTVTALLLAGSMATIRKTGAVVPAVALLTLFVFRPRGMLRILPIGLVILVVIQAIAPGAMVKVKAQLLPSRFNQSPSTQGRKDDYKAVKPDVRHKMALGRGYGTYDPEVYRYVDNQFLMLRVESGLLGVLAYALMIVAVVGAAYPAINSGDPRRAPPALAAAAGATAFGVATFLYDILAFPHAPYIFFFLAAMAVVASSARARPEASRPEWSPGRPLAAR